MFKFREIWTTENGEIVRYLPDKKKQNFAGLSSCRYCSDSAQNLPGKAVEKRLNRSRCCLGDDSCGSKEPYVLDGGPDPPTGRGTYGGEAGDEAFCQIILNTCYNVIIIGTAYTAMRKNTVVESNEIKSLD